MFACGYQQFHRFRVLEHGGQEGEASGLVVGKIAYGADSVQGELAAAIAKEHQTADLGSPVYGVHLGDVGQPAVMQGEAAHGLRAAGLIDHPALGVPKGDVGHVLFKLIAQSRRGVEDHLVLGIAEQQADAFAFRIRVGSGEALAAGSVQNAVAAHHHPFLGDQVVQAVLTVQGQGVGAGEFGGRRFQGHQVHVLAADGEGVQGAGLLGLGIFAGQDVALRVQQGPAEAAFIVPGGKAGLIVWDNGLGAAA